MSFLFKRSASLNAMQSFKTLGSNVCGRHVRNVHSDPYRTRSGSLTAAMQSIGGGGDCRSPPVCRYQSARSFFGHPYRTRSAINWGVRIAPEKSAYVVERFGKFFKILEPGEIHFLTPIVYRIPYVHSLKEQSLPLSNQTAVTKDNVPINIDGVLYIKIIDPLLASYGVDNPINSVVQLAQTTMRSELGKFTLDKTFKERDTLNQSILDAINDWPLRTDWGLVCLRYEIKDIFPPKGMQEAMELQAEAERRKRAKILESEGMREAEINVADGYRRSVILESEAAMIDQANRGQGEAEAILTKAQATAKGIKEVSKAIEESGGAEATSLRIAEQYIGAFGEIVEKSNTMLLPKNSGGADVASMVAQAATVYNEVSKKKGRVY